MTVVYDMLNNEVTTQSGPEVQMVNGIQEPLPVSDIFVYDPSRPATASLVPTLTSNSLQDLIVATR